MKAVFIFLLLVFLDSIFESKYLNSNQKIYFLNLRFYDSNLGKFTQPDSINPDPTNSQAFNRYTYVNNNPLRFTDPSGHVPHDANLKKMEETATNAYVLDFSSNHGRYLDLVQNGLQRLVGDAGTIFLGGPTHNHHKDSFLLRSVIGSHFDPKKMVARRIHMQQNFRADPDSIQTKMFEAMQYAFTGAPVYIQSSRSEADDYGRDRLPNDVPLITKYFPTSVTASHMGSAYIYAANEAGFETYGLKNEKVRRDFHTGLGHEIGHVFNAKKTQETIFPLIDGMDLPIVLELLVYNAAFELNKHPASAENERFRRERGIGDITLEFDNKLVRPSLNVTFGFKKYKWREYYYEDTFELEQASK